MPHDADTSETEPPRSGLEQALKRFAASLDAGHGEAAAAGLLGDLPGGVEEPDLAIALTRTLTAHGTGSVALRCIEALPPSLQNHPEPGLFHVRLLIRMGRLDAARDRLADLSAAADQPAYWQLKVAIEIGSDRSLDATGDARDAQAKLPDSAALRQAEIRALIVRADYATAERRLAEALDLFPDTPGLMVQQVALQRLTRGPEAALPLARDLAARFERHLPAQLSQVDCLTDLGAFSSADAALKEIAARFPRAAIPHIRLARLALTEDRGDAARRHIDDAERRDPGTMPVELARIDLLLHEDAHDAAIARMEALIARDQATPALMSKLVNARIATGDIDGAARTARQGLARFPGSGALFGSLATRAARVGRAPVETLLSGELGAQMTTPRRQALHARLALDGASPHRALGLLREKPPARRTLADVVSIGRALVLSNRNHLAMRYLGLCLRVRGAAPGLVSRYAQAAIRCGRPEGALAGIEALGDRETPAIRNALMLIRSAMGDAEGAFAQWQDCLAAGDLPQRNAVQKLFRSLVADGRADRLTALLEKDPTAGLRAAPHGQASFQGQFVTEVRIALASGDSGPLQSIAPADDTGHARLMANFRQSNLAAMRMLRHWHRSGAEAHPGREPPRRIVQYWDSPHRPAAIDEMIATWRSADGFEHRLFDRRSALAYLRTHFGEDWLRAFRLARSPAEEADFLRLCVLARDGGVYADADDRRIGSLLPLLRPGLFLLLEPGLANVANNFIAAPPQHPVLLHAADLARQELISQSNESAWSKTGPGLLTRAVAGHLADCIARNDPIDIHLLTNRDMSGRVAIHNPAPHKRGPADWRGQDRTDPGYAMAQVLSDFAEATGAA